MGGGGGFVPLQLMIGWGWSEGEGLRWDCFCREQTEGQRELG